MMGHTMWLGGFWMWLVPLVAVGLVGWLLWRLAGGSLWSAEDRVHVEELLRARYEAGEIDRAEFEKRLAFIHRAGS